VNHIITGWKDPTRAWSTGNDPKKMQTIIHITGNSWQTGNEIR
jgi:hypothetical protein